MVAVIAFERVQCGPARRLRRVVACRNLLECLISASVCVVCDCLVLESVLVGLRRVLARPAGGK